MFCPSDSQITLLWCVANRFSDVERCKTVVQEQIQSKCGYMQNLYMLTNISRLQTIVHKRKQNA